MLAPKYSTISLRRGETLNPITDRDQILNRVLKPAYYTTIHGDGKELNLERTYPFPAKDGHMGYLKDGLERMSRIPEEDW